MSLLDNLFDDTDSEEGNIINNVSTDFFGVPEPPTFTTINTFFPVSFVSPVNKSELNSELKDKIKPIEETNLNKSYCLKILIYGDILLNKMLDHKLKYELNILSICSSFLIIPGSSCIYLYDINPKIEVKEVFIMLFYFFINTLNEENTINNDLEETIKPMIPIYWNLLDYVLDYNIFY